jgi:hypothetical protein
VDSCRKWAHCNIDHGNAGWVGAVAATRSKDVAFLIVKSGSGYRCMKNILYELEMT